MSTVVYRNDFMVPGTHHEVDLPLEDRGLRPALILSASTGGCLRC